MYKSEFKNRVVLCAMRFWFLSPSRFTFCVQNDTTSTMGRSKLFFVTSQIHSFILLLILPFILPFIHSSFHPSILSFIHPSIHSFIHSFIHSSIHSSILPFILPFFHSFFHSSIHSSILPFILPFFHSFFHSSIHSSNQQTPTHRLVHWNKHNKNSIRCTKALKVTQAAKIHINHRSPQTTQIYTNTTQTINDGTRAQNYHIKTNKKQQ